MSELNDQKIQSLKELRSLLVYHQHMGVAHYPFSKDIETFLISSQPSETIGSHNIPRSETNTPAPLKRKIRHQGTIDEIAAEICNCMSCNLCSKRVFPVPGSGGSQVKLFIIGGWLSLQKQHTEKSSIFGKEEDRMLERMLTAIGLSAEDAFVSNVIKCGIDESVQPKAENISACLSYLFRQIAATSPVVICTMGIVAARALLQISQPLSQLRGRFHQYHVDDKRTIPVMPTYHPTFLLQNPEMKKATWDDLQAIAKIIQGQEG